MSKPKVYIWETCSACNGTGKEKIGQIYINCEACNGEGKVKKEV